MRPINPASPDAAITVAPPSGPADAGPTPILEDELPSIQTSQCLPGGQGAVVASYRKPAGAAASVGRTIDLVPTTKNANLWQCLRGAPSKFAVALDVLPAYLPATDTAISLKVCISAHASATYP